MTSLEDAAIPEKVSVLRLDTDYYLSTLKEMQILYPRIEHGGVIMIDDFGYCEGARTAVEEYFTEKERPMFQIIDVTGRLAVKVH